MGLYNFFKKEEKEIVTLGSIILTLSSFAILSYPYIRGFSNGNFNFINILLQSNSGFGFMVVNILMFFMFFFGLHIFFSHLKAK